MAKLKVLMAVILLSMTILASGIVVLPAGRASAYACQDGSQSFDYLDRVCPEEKCNGSFLGLPSWHQYLPKKIEMGGSCSVVLPERDGQTDVTKTVGYIAIAVVEAMLRVSALVAVGYIIYGGYRFILSQGEPENAKSARQTIINALIGLVIAIAAASIVSFVAGRLTN